LAVESKEYFETLQAQADASKIAGMTNSYLFEIEGAGEWLVDVRDGAVTVTEGGGDADTTIITTKETFDKILAREQNPTTAYMTGKLKVKGDISAALKLEKLY
jgi:putative sterol carrier protein